MVSGVGNGAALVFAPAACCTRWWPPGWMVPVSGVRWALVPFVVGFLNDRYLAGPDNPGGYAGGMWFYTLLSSLGL